MVNLNKKVELLESRIAISENVSERLSQELDRLDQYHRRPNIILKHALLPESETDSTIKGTVVNILEKELSLPGIAEDIDKLHRVGKIKTVDGKKQQNIIVRFKTHFSRYAVYNERKKAKSVKIVPNLNQRRRSLLYEASKLVSGFAQVLD